MLLNRVKPATVVLLALGLFASSAAAEDGPLKRPLRVDTAHVSTDKTIAYDYDIVYVRAPRTAPGKGGKEQPGKGGKEQPGKGGKEQIALVWPDASQPFQMMASTDLMLL